MVEDLDETLVPSPRVTADPPGVGGPDLENTQVTDRPLTRPVRPTATAAQPPQYYLFRVGSRTDPIALDRPCFVGRRPSAPRIIRDAAPRLLQVPSPLKEVSATHLELRQLGNSVIVTDLRSTNGTVVTLPGSAPRKLRQGESLVVSPGTLVDIGDDNVLHILPMQQLAAEGSERGDIVLEGAMPEDAGAAT